MTAPFQGGCVCGEIRYECAAEPIVVFHCHCRDCQRFSGGQMSTAALVPKASFQLLRGRPQSYGVTSNSGNTLKRLFCGNCGAALFTDLGTMMPDAWIIKAASLDDPSWLKPRMHIWASSAQPWDSMSDGLPCHPENPPV